METHEYTSSCAITQTKKTKREGEREMLMSECQKGNITVHSQSKNPAGEDTVSAGRHTGGMSSSLSRSQLASFICLPRLALIAPLIT